MKSKSKRPRGQSVKITYEIVAKSDCSVSCSYLLLGTLVRTHGTVLAYLAYLLTYRDGTASLQLGCFEREFGGRSFWKAEKSR